ncbi:GNAT family N-acetyltransferase [Psychrobacter sanguinis]|uniref:GNAT family N-acetyltransferase n=1 Tax=Psychrobacter sanguinis TaxID=861445 RepID=UPI00289DA948|nr:GNAT family protein [Psychrobacter sanguinis]
MFTRKIDDDLSLALVQPSIAKDYLQIVTEQREELSTFLTWPAKAHDEDFFIEYIRSVLHAYAEGEALICAIVYQGKIIGSIGLNAINHDLKKANLGYWLSKHYRGQGIITRCTSEFVKIGFEELGLSKIEIKASVDNSASRAVPERLGFTLEGIITQSERVGDRIVDHAVYGLQKIK